MSAHGHAPPSMRRRGQADEVTLPCNVRLLHSCQDVLPLGDEASHLECLGVIHSLLEERAAPLNIVSAAPLQMCEPQFGACLDRGWPVVQTRAGYHRSVQVFDGEVELAAR